VKLSSVGAFHRWLVEPIRVVASVSPHVYTGAKFVGCKLEVYYPESIDKYTLFLYEDNNGKL
jgi:hypothetical protein